MKCHEHEFMIPVGHPVFVGHFPGNPVVPGVLLLDTVIYEMETAMGMRITGYRLDTVKFHSPVPPGESLRLRVTELDGKRMTFEMHAGTRLVAGGGFSGNLLE